MGKSVTRHREAAKLAAEAHCTACASQAEVAKGADGFWHVSLRHETWCPVADTLRRLRARNGGLP